MCYKTEAHPPRSEYVIYECINLLFVTRSIVHVSLMHLLGCGFIYYFKDVLAYCHLKIVH